jgi:hypothetical protein
MISATTWKLSESAYFTTLDLRLDAQTNTPNLRARRNLANRRYDVVVFTRGCRGGGDDGGGANAEWA